LATPTAGVGPRPDDVAPGRTGVGAATGLSLSVLSLAQDLTQETYFGVVRRLAAGTQVAE